MLASDQTFKIFSQDLIVEASSRGAEMISVKDKVTGFEYLWQADPTIWNRHAPVLFPIVGRLNEDVFRHKGQRYELKQHGFARDCDFALNERFSDAMGWVLKSDEQLLTKYPFPFVLGIFYRVEGRTVEVTYQVINPSNEQMYFSIGAHPGFNLPEPQIDQYELHFEKSEKLERLLLQNGLFSGEAEIISGKTLMLELNASLFEKDAIVLKELKSKKITLVHKNSEFRVGIEFDDFPYFGIWTKPGTSAFVCLEPWIGLADSKGFDKEISQKEGIVCLEPMESTHFSYTMTFTS